MKDRRPEWPGTADGLGDIFNILLRRSRPSVFRSCREAFFSRLATEICESAVNPSAKRGLFLRRSSVICLDRFEKTVAAAIYKHLPGNKWIKSDEWREV